MRKFKYYFMAIILGSMIVISGCDDDNNPADPGPNTFGSYKLNGGGYNNQTATIVDASAVYDSTEMETTVILRGRINTDTTRVVITFPGKTTGNFAWEGITSYLQFFAQGSTTYFSIDGSTNITSYGNVNSNIEGTFQGTVSLFSADSISIDGNFKARRGPDIVDL